MPISSARGDLLPLWQTDLQGKMLGSCARLGVKPKSCGRIGLKNGRYFNSGVLLMDLVKWRQQKLTQKLFRWLEQVGSTKILWGRPGRAQRRYRRRVYRAAQKV